VRILIVDDHQLFIDGIRHILNTLDDQVEIIEFNAADDAIQYIDHDNQIDLALIDLNMPGMDGLSIIKRSQTMDNSLPIVVLSAEEDIHAIDSIMRAGAMGFIPKSSTSSALLSALLKVKEGEIYIPREIQAKINQLTPKRRIKSIKRNNNNGTSLTGRQYEILELLARGYSNKQLSTALFISENTVKAHISAIFKALGVNSRTQCLQTARLKGLIDN
jgi:DNA-binding NarL/FixJ family response regulator